MDLMYLLLFAIPLAAQVYVKTTYNKYIKIKSNCNLNGFDMAKKILKNNGLDSLYIVETKGVMTDHYDPTRKTV